MNTDELPDMRDSDGEVRLTFIWDTESHYEDEEEDNLCDHEEEYIGKTWQEACDNAADCYDWDDEDVINFSAESDLIETSRDLTMISYYDPKKGEGEWVEVPQEVYDYFGNAEEKAMGIND
tara:strand:- start:1355 stop:1717 length:363 start_codon:yes stop_codon:yes gene_type:complete